jgi:hypothetical protein
MTLQELRAEWQRVKNLPADDGERQRIESEMFWQFHQAVQRQQKGQIVFDNNIDLNEVKREGRGMKRR